MTIIVIVLLKKMTHIYYEKYPKATPRFPSNLPTYVIIKINLKTHKFTCRLPTPILIKE